MADKAESVKVVVRVRPLSSKETEDGRKVIVRADTARSEVLVESPSAEGGSGKELPKTFTFDYTYGAESTQKQIYDISASPIVDSVLRGFNGTIFAYGQTGAGKSHTMEGLADKPDLRGIIPNSFKHIFDHINANTDPNKQFLVRASYLEIYNEEIRDLLGKDKTQRLELKENVEREVYVKDLMAVVVKSAAEMDTVLQNGKKNRVTGATLMNETSSRSHAVFLITLETAETGDDGKSHIRVGKLNLVDLAGSERQSKTAATGMRLKEATKINQSLSALGNVISALVDGRSTHIPYRDSKLTRLLQDSLGGNTKTVMVANCGPADYNYDETLSTLRWADRAKQIRNKPKINEDPKDAMLREFQEEIARLRQRLAAEEERAKAASGATTMIIDGKSVTVPGTVVVERVVEKITGATDAQMREMREKAESERAGLVAKAEEERRILLLAAAKTEEDRRRIEAELATRHSEAEQIRKEKKALEEQLQQMQGKLIVGSGVLDKAAKQEEALRKAQIELDERRRQESTLARELEEANVMIEEQYASMAEELEAKTRKLKKVWHKLEAAKAEIRDLAEEFQIEREDMLDTTRELDKQNKLLAMILDHFVPKEERERIEARSIWDEETGEWSLHRAELAGNRLRVRRPPSTLSPAYTALYATLPMPQARPVTQHSILRAQSDSDPRFRADNIATMDLEWGQFSAPAAEKLTVVAQTKVVAGGT